MSFETSNERGEPRTYIARLAEVDAEILAATRPEVVHFMGNSVALVRLRAEREELRAAIARAEQ